MLFAAMGFVAGVVLAFGCATLPSLTALSGLSAAAAVVWLAGGRAAGALLAGFVAASLQGHHSLDDDWPCARDRERLVITGRVATAAELRRGRVDFDLASDRAARALGVPRLLRLSWYEPAGTPRPGEHWRVEVVLRCRNGFVNPGGYERELELLRRGYGATGYLAGDAGARRLESRGLRAPVEAARAWIGERIEAAAGQSRSAGVLQGLAVGLRGGIEPAIRDAFVATGTAHLIAISGMHVTAFAVVVVAACRRAYALAGRPALSPRWPALQAAVVFAFTAAYGLLAGASLPTVRTVCMVSVALLLRVARRGVPTLEILGASAWMLAAADPLGVTSAGFWLSFAAVAALLGLVGLTGGAWRLLREYGRAQAAVTLVLAPVLVGAFGGVPLAGVAANAVAIPVFSLLVLPATLTGTLLLPLAPGFAAWWWAVLGAALDRCWPLLEWVGNLPGAVYRPPAAAGWLLAAALVSAIAAIAIPGWSAKRLACIAMAALLFRPPVAPPPGAFELAMLDVGQGLAVVLRTARRVLVFDTGARWRSGGAAAGVTLIPYLRALGVTRVDTLVVSHADADHAGGLDELVAAFDPAWIIGDAGPRHVLDEPCVAGRSWQWDMVTFTIVHPAAGAAFRGNDGSCAMRVSAAGGSALLLADTEGRAERSMLARDLAADVVTVGHHGSDSSSTPAFVAAVGARWALVSAGYGNRWGLPRAAVVRRWSEAGATVLSTAERGALQIEVGPGGVSREVEGWRRSEARWWRRE